MSGTLNKEILIDSKKAVFERDGFFINSIEKCEGNRQSTVSMQFDWKDCVATTVSMQFDRKDWIATIFYGRNSGKIGITAPYK